MRVPDWRYSRVRPLRRRNQRRATARGFALTEALVALAIAALTITVLTSSSWGLATAAERRAAAAQAGPADWLAARRALLQWTAGLTAVDPEDIAPSLTGTATTLRLYVEPQDGGLLEPFIAALDVVAVDADNVALRATRFPGQVDARVGGDDGQTTEILRSREPIRILYFYSTGRGQQGGTWRYETDSEGLPDAIGVEVGDTRRLTAPIFVNRSAACVARLGRGGLEDSRCALR